MEEKLNPFHIHVANYKIVGSTPIEVTILIPKGLKAGRAPLLVRWHGGYLVTGTSLDPDLLFQWVLDFAIKHSAIYVIPNYRLMPESTGLDILEDVADFWNWTLTQFPSVIQRLSPSHEVNLSSIVVMGESAGGYLAIQSALLHPQVKLKAVVAAYPVLDATGPFFATAQRQTMLGFPPQPKSVTTDYIAAIVPGTVKTSAEGEAHDLLAISMIQNGLYLQLLGSSERLQPFQNLKKYNGKLPFLWTYHGRQDTGVPVDGTEKWEALLQTTDSAAQWKVTYEDGEHGFDSEANLNTPWLQEGLTEVEKYWP